VQSLNDFGKTCSLVQLLKLRVSSLKLSMSCGRPTRQVQPTKIRETRPVQPHPPGISLILVPLRLRVSIPIHDRHPLGSSAKDTHPFKLSFFKCTHLDELCARYCTDAQLEKFISSILSQSSVARAGMTRRVQPIAEKERRCTQLKASTGKLSKESQKSSFMSLRCPQLYTPLGSV
jgi:hypothetical protein